MAPRLSWPPIIERAREIVESYSIKITLRQLFYRLVAEGTLRNIDYHYSRLSELTAEGRRKDAFPALSDRGRHILRPRTFSDTSDSLDWLTRNYLVDRTEGQDVQLYLGVEKNAMAGLMQDWYEDWGIPILPLGGYSSETLERDVMAAIEADGRKAVLIYAGDFDASGEDIGRSFVAHTQDAWAETIRIGLSEELIEAHRLPVLRGKVDDSRAEGFVARHVAFHDRYDFGLARTKGGKVLRVPAQVEMDALEPMALNGLFRDAIERYWDWSKYDAALDREEAGRRKLASLARVWRRQEQA